MRAANTRIAGWALAALLTGVGTATWLGTLIRALPYTVDDAYITFRYSYNLVHFGRLAFNPSGGPAEGYTSPLWVLTCAVPEWLGSDPVWFSKALSALLMLGAMGLAGWTAWSLCERRSAPVRLLAGALPVLLVGLRPASAIHAVSGMETSAFTFLLTAVAALSTHLVAHPRRGLMVAYAATCLLTGLARPEGNLFCGVNALALVVVLPVPARAHLLRSFAWLYVVPGAVYLFARWRYFGLLAPLPFYVKVGGVGAFAGFEEVRSFLAELGLPFLALAVVGVVTRFRRTAPVFLGSVAFVVFFCVPRHLMGFESRFLFPIVPTLTVLAVAALDVRIQAPRSIELGVGAVVIALLSYGPGRLWSTRAVRLAPLLAYAEGLERAHIRLGRALADHPARLLALGDAGAVPYYARGRTIDTFGLNEPMVALTRPYPTGYVLEQHPDLLVLISRSPTVFDPPLPHERLLYDAALVQGYLVWRTLEFDSAYHLWLLTPAERPDPGLIL